MTTSDDSSVDGESAEPRLDVAALLGFGTATIHEAAGQGSVLPIEIRSVIPGGQLCGRAFTVETGPGHNLWIHRALYEAPQGSVLVVSCGDGYEFGYWGEILSTAAKECGLAGLVINGCVRDSVALAEVGFPVFARGLCVRGTGKQAGDGTGLGMPLKLGSAVVNPGDIILGDADGVISLPFGTNVGLRERAAARTSKELVMMEDLRRGSRSTDLLNLEPAR